jgi:hypothetical protein
VLVGGIANSILGTDNANFNHMDIVLDETAILIRLSGTAGFLTEGPTGYDGSMDISLDVHVSQELDTQTHHISATLPTRNIFLAPVVTLQGVVETLVPDAPRKKISLLLTLELLCTKLIVHHVAGTIVYVKPDKCVSDVH